MSAVYGVWRRLNPLQVVEIWHTRWHSACRLRLSRSKSGTRTPKGLATRAKPRHLIRRLTPTKPSEVRCFRRRKQLRLFPVDWRFLAKCCTEPSTQLTTQFLTGLSAEGGRFGAGRLRVKDGPGPTGRPALPCTPARPASVPVRRPTVKEDDCCRFRARPVESKS
jgi:hypothetical protein